MSNVRWKVTKMMKIEKKTALQMLNIRKATEQMLNVRKEVLDKCWIL
jgi:hypothetical protein